MNMDELLPQKISSPSHTLVEAPMESNLNLAHTFSRRADMLTKSRKYEEAISCHRKAAEYLLQAMEHAPPATPNSLLESMILQHKAYLSEINRLQCKNQLLELMDRHDKATATISQATQTDSIHSIDTTDQISLEEGTIYEILRENDDIMQRLGKRTKQEKENEDPKSNASQFERSVSISGQPTIDEVAELNEKLSHAVCSLLQELGSTKAEKRQMEEKLCDSQELLKNGLEGELRFNSLNLPPLEVSYPELALLKMDT